MAIPKFSVLKKINTEYGTVIVVYLKNDGIFTFSIYIVKDGNCELLKKSDYIYTKMDQYNWRCLNNQTEEETVVTYNDIQTEVKHILTESLQYIALFYSSDIAYNILLNAMQQIVI